MRTLPLIAATAVGPALILAGVLLSPVQVGEELLAAGSPVEIAAPAAVTPPATAPPVTEAVTTTVAVPVAVPVAEAGKDLTGAPLSPVAVAGPDGPPVPGDSGAGRRLVFARDQQRVWAVGDDGVVVRTWLVAGSRFGNDLPGTYTVFTRARWTSSYTGGAQLQWFVGFYRTPRDNVIGFHEIPRTSKGMIHGVELLGTKQSSGCIRQASEDAAFLYDWAPEGTIVVIV